MTYTGERVCREYALPGGSREKEGGKSDGRRELEKMKEALLPFVRETVKKQLKEEREYYKSRPALAARQLEGIFGTGSMESAFVQGVAGRVYERLEEQLRMEWVRKGG